MFFLLRCLAVFAAGSGLLAGTEICWAQDAPAPSATPLPSPPALQAVSPGVYRLGQVTMDKNARQVRFPAVVNQTEGPVEYLLVGSRGKVHESVLRTDVEPTQVHTAMLLLGVKIPVDKGAPALPAPPAAIDADYLAATPLPPGVPVALRVRWQPPGEGATPVECRAEALVDDARTKGAMAAGNWLYNGSFVAQGRFQAEVEKSFVAVITDPAALLNNLRSGHDDESLWTAATARLPKSGTAVELIIQLPPATP